MVESNLQAEEVEIREPVAHPHYPMRVLGAARPYYQVVEKADEDNASEEGE